MSALSALCVAGSAAAASFFDANPATLGPIPDGGSTMGPCNPGAPRLVEFNVTGLQPPISDVRVSFAFAPTHGWVGDLLVVLNGPGGVGSQSIFGRTGATTDSFGDDSDLLGLYTFSDSAPASPKWWDAATTADGSTAIPIGSYRASTQGGVAGGGTNTLITPTFASLANPNGTWTLKFIDCASSLTTSVTAATLGLTTPTPGSSLKAQVSNQFSFRKLKLNKDKGTATLTVDVPGPGKLTLGGKGLVGQRLGRGAAISKVVAAAGKVNLKVKAKGSKKTKLNDTGKVTVRPKITFSPTGGIPFAQTKKITLKKNL